MLTPTIHARSIGLRAQGILQPGVTGRVQASFDRVCNLVTDSGAIVALVWEGIEEGPLNVVLAARPGTVLPAGARFGVFERILTTDGWQIDLRTAAPWDARPDWAHVRTQYGRISTRTQGLSEMLANHEQALSRTGQPGMTEGFPLSAGLVAAVLQADRTGDRAGLIAALNALCGLGPGLTPAGDDWLAGWLLGRRCRPDIPLTACAGDPGGPLSAAQLEAIIMELSAGRTTTLSRAFLLCAAAGEADAPWHTLLASLTDDARGIERAAQAILRRGATSGAAMLAGFLAGLGAA